VHPLPPIAFAALESVRICRQDVDNPRGRQERRRGAIQTPSFPDAQLRIVDGASASDPESRDSGLDASHRPGMTESELSDASLLAKTVILREMSSPETCTLRLLDSITDASEY
jgi:hypothetical protein